MHEAFKKRSTCSSYVYVCVYVCVCVFVGFCETASSFQFPFHAFEKHLLHQVTKKITIWLLFVLFASRRDRFSGITQKKEKGKTTVHPSLA